MVVQSVVETYNLVVSTGECILVSVSSTCKNNRVYIIRIRFNMSRNSRVRGCPASPLTIKALRKVSQKQQQYKDREMTAILCHSSKCEKLSHCPMSHHQRQITKHICNDRYLGRIHIVIRDNCGPVTGNVSSNIHG